VKPIPKTLNMALEHHRAGRVREAEILYRQILQSQPDHPNALHLLGLIAHQAGRHADALKLIGRAIALKPAAPEFHNDIGEAFRAMGRDEEAKASYHRALSLKADMPYPAYNLGILYHHQGNLEEAMACYRRALKGDPKNAEAHNNLGNVLKELGRVEEAVAHYRRALALKPDFAEVCHNLGVAFQEQGKLEEATAHYRQALRLKPGYASACNNLEVLLKEYGIPDEAPVCFQRSKVISFSLWGDNPKYTIGAIRNAIIAKEIYPDWKCIFHVGKSVPSDIIDSLRLNRNSELVFRGEDGDWDSTLWRFYPAFNPSVDVMISRDTDSRLSLREKRCVDEWLASDKDFHIMRDHPLHCPDFCDGEILAGMWGVRNGLLQNFKEIIENNCIKCNVYGIDQKILREHIFPQVKDKSFVHDSFYERRPDWFIATRVPLHFVGQVYNEFDEPQCS
jgi:Flp pilus assembly protein TadD